MEVPYLPLENYYAILLQSDIETVLNACQTNSLVATICRDEGFWKEKYIHDFGVPNSQPKSYRALYQTLYLSQKFETTNQQLIKAIDREDREAVKSIHKVIQDQIHKDLYERGQYILYGEIFLDAAVLYSLYKNQYDIARLIYDNYEMTIARVRSYIENFYLEDDLEKYQRFREHWGDHIIFSDEGELEITEMPSMNIILGYNWEPDELPHILDKLITKVADYPDYAYALFRLCHKHKLSLQQVFELLKSDDNIIDILESDPEIYRKAIRNYNEFLEKHGLNPELVSVEISDEVTIQS